MQRRRPLPAAETGRSCWGRGLQDASAAQGTKQTQGAATRIYSAEKLFLICSPGTPAELVGAKPLHLANARPFCRLKAPLGLSLLRNRGLFGVTFSREGSQRQTAVAAVGLRPSRSDFKWRNTKKR